MIVWVAAAALAALLVALEVRRPRRQYLALRISAVVAATAALALLLRPPLLPATPGPLRVAIVTTPGTDRSTRSRLADSLPGAHEFPLPDSISDLDALRRRIPDLQSVVIAGSGLRASMLSRHTDLEVRHALADAPRGFSRIHWTREVTLGDQAIVTAVLGPAARRRVARFEGPAGERDSLTISADSTGPVTFRTTPRATGMARVVLSLAGSPTDTLPLVVRRGRTPAVLILDGAPSFESTFLRRWLSSQGAQVAVRTTISRGRDRIDRVNFPEQRLRPLTPDLLDRFDVVRLDGPTLAALSAAERAALKAAVVQGGLGLLVAPDSLARKDSEFFPFRVSPTGDIEDRLVRPLWSGRSDRATTPVPAAAESVEPATSLLTLMRDPIGRVLAAAERRGAGVIATSVVLAPSRWLMEEEAEPFAGYWSTLLEAVARRRGDRWAVAPDGPITPRLPVTLTLETESATPAATITGPRGRVDSLGLVQDLTDPGRWWGRFWPAEPGVYTATNGLGDPYPFIVEAAAESDREVAARRDATSWWSGANGGVAPAVLTGRRRPLGALLPFVVLVISLTVLWGETRAVSFFTSNQ